MICWNLFFVQLVLCPAVIIENQTQWINSWINHFTLSWINSKVNGNHEITTWKQKRNFFLPYSGSEPRSHAIVCQCATNELRWTFPAINSTFGYNCTIPTLLGIAGWNTQHYLQPYQRVAEFQCTTTIGEI